MKIDFNNLKHGALANNYEALCKKYNKREQNHAEDIIVAMDALRAASSLFDVPCSFNPHPLSGIYKECFAIDVNKKERIIFKPNHANDSNFRIDKYKTITSILIIEIFINYHKS